MTRRPSHWSCVAVLAMLAIGARLNAEDLLPAETCNGDYGTSVKFLESPAAAAKKAAKEEKLVFVLHVSGNFEVSDYT